MRESLTQAMHLPAESDVLSWLHERGLGVADHDTMSRAVHDVYCGATADHKDPDEKDRQQAQLLIEAMQRHTSAF